MKEDIKKILLLPIKPTTRKKIDIHIEEKDCVEEIITGVRYIPSGSKTGKLDCDVSDFAIKFYETVYGKVPILNSNRSPVNDEFIGDTMNTIHKNINYHCLANFWILPSDLGRTIKKYSKAKADDRMEFFLMDLKYNYSIYRDLYPEYFDFFENFENFCEKHFLDEAYFDEHDKSILSTMQEANVIKIIEDRAETIASRKTKELYNLFSEVLGLMKND